jgi:hypothetical protein
MLSTHYMRRTHISDVYISPRYPAIGVVVEPTLHMDSPPRVCPPVTWPIVSSPLALATMMLPSWTPRLSEGARVRKDDHEPAAQGPDASEPVDGLSGEENSLAGGDDLPEGGAIAESGLSTLQVSGQFDEIVDANYDAMGEITYEELIAEERPRSIGEVMPYLGKQIKPVVNVLLIIIARVRWWRT